MSKKLIAVASAAALALSALVAAPASATAQSFAMSGATGGTTTGLSSSTPATVNVPFLNTIASGSNAVTITGTGAAADVMTATSTGSVKLVTAGATGTKDLNVTTLGTASKTRTIASGETTTTVLAYNTSVTAGTVVVTLTRPGTSVSATTTFHLKGVAGPAYNIQSVSGFPSTLAKAATSVITFTLSDVFGNAVENSATTATLTTRSADMGAITYDSAAKVYKSTLTSASSSAFVSDITLEQSDGTELDGAAEGADTDGFADGTKSILGVVNSAGAGAQVTSLTAQVAALTAQLANSRGKDVSVTKKKFNALAKRWNSAFPGQKVALKQ